MSKKSLLVSTLAFVTTVTAQADDLRIGMVGLDTSHVTAFLQIFNDPQSKEHIAGGRIVAAFKGGSPDIESSRARIDDFTQTAVSKYGVKLYNSIEELAQNVDAIMILSLDGRPHLDQFRRTLAAKKPVFIDKPIAGSLKDTVEIIRLSRETKVPVFSSSSLRYPLDSPLPKLEKLGAITSAISFGPAELEPHHPDLFWYGVHTVEALYAVLGAGCVSVVRTHTENTDIVTGVWSDGRVGTMQGNRQGHKGYGVTVIATKGVATGGEQHSYTPLAVEIMKFFQTGIAPVPLETTLEIFAFMEAADESKRRGGVPVTLGEVLAAAGTTRR
jgi:predicted dehydrogenase